MATEAVEERTDHIRGVTVTAFSCLAGITAALISSYATAGAENPAGDPLAIWILGAFIVFQFPVLTTTKLKTDLSIKDYLYVSFMTFALWFVTWTILLTSDVTVGV